MIKPNWLDEVLDSLNEDREPLCYPVLPHEKQTGNKITEPETRMDKRSSDSVTPVTPVTPKNNVSVKKSADIVETQRERRRLKVLAILAENPNTPRAIITDVESDPDNVILTIAIRDQYSFEMAIPRDKYDPFVILELISEGVVQ